MDDKKKEVIKESLKEAKKEEKHKVPTQKELEKEDQQFIKQAWSLKRLLSPNLWFLKKKK